MATPAKPQSFFSLFAQAKNAVTIHFDLDSFFRVKTLHNCRSLIGAFHAEKA